MKGTTTEAWKRDTEEGDMLLAIGQRVDRTTCSFHVCSNSCGKHPTRASTSPERAKHVADLSAEPLATRQQSL